MTPNRNCYCGRTMPSAPKASINRPMPPTTPMRNERIPNGYPDCKCPPEDGFPIGMAYVPWQKFCKIYDPAKALCQGTIFAQLDKPFCGRRVNR